MAKRDKNKELDAVLDEVLTLPAREGEEDEALEQDFVRKKKYIFDLRLLPVIAVAALLLSGLLWWAFTAESAGPGLVISEVMTANHGAYEHETLGTPDWVELYNGSDSAIDLTGYGLSNNIKHSYLFTFPAVTIGPGEYLLVYFTGGTAEADDDPLCTGFGLDKNGDSVFLTAPAYRLVDNIKIPALESDTSYARGSDGSFSVTQNPTPGSAN